MSRIGIFCCPLQNKQGQAATEFLIAAVYVLIPLFLVIPLVGKYIDIKQAAIQQARFEAWEYTAWFMHKKNIMDYPQNRPSKRSAARPWRETRKAGKRIFFSDNTSPAYGTEQAGGAFVVNPLWRDHRSKSLFKNDEQLLNGSLVEADTPNPSGKNYINDLINGISDITTTVEKILHFEGQHAGFDALNTKGYFKSTVTLSLRSPGEVSPFFSLAGDEYSTGSSLKLTGKAAVLTDCWDAGSTENAIAETKGLVLSSLLEPLSKTINHLINEGQKILNYLEIDIHVAGIDIGKFGIEATLPHAPSFGYVKNGLIPYEHLQGNNKEVTDYKGLYYYRDKKD